MHLWAEGEIQFHEITYAVEIRSVVKNGWALLKMQNFSNGQLLFNSEFFYWIFFCFERFHWENDQLLRLNWSSVIVWHFWPLFQFFPAQLGLTIGQFNCGMDWHCFFCCFSLRCSLLIKSKHLKFVTNFFRFLSAPNLMLVLMLDQIDFTEKWRQRTRNCRLSVLDREHRTTLE